MTTVQPKPLTYTEKLVLEFEKSGKKTYTLADVKAVIDVFSKREYELRKKNIDVMPFGKYKLKKVKDVAAFDPQYFTWLLKQDIMDKYTELKSEINSHLKK